MDLYKYVGKYVVEIVRFNRLKVTSPSDLDDPFEFSPILKKRDKSELWNWFNNTHGPNRVCSSLVAQGLANNVGEAKTLMERDLPTNLVLQREIENAANEYVKNYPYKISKEFGVTSFTTKREDLLMWSFYSDQYRGAVIKFDSSKLRELGEVLRVSYTNQRPEWDPVADEQSRRENIRNIITTKSQTWSFQNEWRLLTPLNNCTRGENKLKSYHFIELPDSCITEIITGFRFSRNQELISAVGTKDIKISGTYKDDQRFRLKYVGSGGS